MAIAALVLWLLTAGAGVSLLASANVARRQPAEPAPAAAPAGAPARHAALPLSDEGRPPPGPHTKVVAPAGEHPLLEFSHPALAITGMGFWLAFVLVHDRTLAWISLAVLLLTLGAGLSWLARTTLAARRRQAARRSFPARLVLLHGAAAAAVVALTVLAALTAARG